MSLNVVQNFIIKYGVDKYYQFLTDMNRGCSLKHIACYLHVSVPRVSVYAKEMFECAFIPNEMSEWYLEHHADVHRFEHEYERNKYQQLKERANEIQAKKKCNILQFAPTNSLACVPAPHAD